MDLRYLIYENIKTKNGYVWSEPKLDKIKYCGSFYECISFMLQVNSKTYWKVLGFGKYQKMILDLNLQVGEKVKCIGNAEYPRLLSIRKIEKSMNKKYKQANPLVVFDKWK